MQASDADEGSNAVIDFSLAVGMAESQLFSLQPSNSTVALQLLQTLDRETSDFYSLRLQATDRGSPSLVGEVTINITVLVRNNHMLETYARKLNFDPQDINDEVPVFAEDQYELNVTEDTEIGTALLTVIASDADIEENAAVSYSTLSSVVTVDPSSGEVILAAMLDHELSNTLEIEVSRSKRDE